MGAIKERQREAVGFIRENREDAERLVLGQMSKKERIRFLEKARTALGYSNKTGHFFIHNCIRVNMETVRVLEFFDAP